MTEHQNKTLIKETECITVYCIALIIKKYGNLKSHLFSYIHLHYSHGFDSLFSSKIRIINRTFG